MHNLFQLSHFKPQKLTIKERFAPTFFELEKQNILNLKAFVEKKRRSYILETQGEFQNIRKYSKKRLYSVVNIKTLTHDDFPQLRMSANISKVVLDKKSLSSAFVEELLNVKTYNNILKIEENKYKTSYKGVLSSFFLEEYECFDFSKIEPCIYFANLNTKKIIRPKITTNWQKAKLCTYGIKDNFSKCKQRINFGSNSILEIPNPNFRTY